MVQGLFNRVECCYRLFKITQKWKLPKRLLSPPTGEQIKNGISICSGISYFTNNDHVRSVTTQKNMDPFHKHMVEQKGRKVLREGGRKGWTRQKKYILLLC
jgi:hypothetical protein